MTTPATLAEAPAVLIDKFEQLAELPSGIKRLRELVLQLAVQGKLVPQDPSNEPASELLKQIEAEKKRLVREGRIKAPKPLSPITEGEFPFALPSGWVWVRLKEITSKITDGDHQTPKRIAAGCRLLSAKNVRDGFLDFDSCEFISEDDYLKSRERCLPETGDLLIVSVGGTIGRSSIVPIDCYFSLVRSVALIKPLKLAPEYLKISMDSNLLQDAIHKNKRGGAQPCLYLSEIEKFVLCLPPLAEQHRIVERVNELMALCDQLEEELAKTAKKRQAYRASALNHLTSATTEQERTAVWQPFAQKFNDVIIDKQAVSDLRKTILQLAVQGKLVPQNPSDEPARELLKRIETEKKRLIKDGTLKPQKLLPFVTKEEQPFPLPSGWQWERLLNLGHTQTGTTPETSIKDYFIGPYPFIKPADIYENGEINYHNDSLSELGIKKARLINPHSILMVCIGGSITKTGIVRQVSSCNQQINSVTPYYLEMTDLIYLVLKSPYFKKLILSIAPQTTLPILSKGKWETLPVPIPPLAEQHRIVERVNELMALCDQLEIELETTQHQGQALLNSLIYHLAEVTR